MPAMYKEREESKPVISVDRLREIVVDEIRMADLEGAVKIEESSIQINVNLGGNTTTFPFDALTFQGNEPNKFPKWVRSKLNWLKQKHERARKAKNTMTVVMQPENESAELTNLNALGGTDRENPKRKRGRKPMTPEQKDAARQRMAAARAARKSNRQEA